MFVEGYVTEDLVDGTIGEIQVKDFRPAPHFDEQKFEKFIGSKPNLTGNLSTEEFVEGFRSDGEDNS